MTDKQQIIELAEEPAPFTPKSWRKACQRMARLAIDDLEMEEAIDLRAITHKGEFVMGVIVVQGSAEEVFEAIRDAVNNWEELPDA